MVLKLRKYKYKMQICQFVIKHRLQKIKISQYLFKCPIQDKPIYVNRMTLYPQLIEI